MDSKSIQILSDATQTATYVVGDFFNDWYGSLDSSIKFSNLRDAIAKKIAAAYDRGLADGLNMRPQPSVVQDWSHGQQVK